MQLVQSFIQKAKQLIQQKSEQSIIELFSNLTKDIQDERVVVKGETSVLIQSQYDNVQDQKKQTLSNLMQQKVLEIDVIQSGFIPNSKDHLVQNSLTKRSSPQGKLAKSKSPSKNKDIQAERKQILQELRLLDEQIAEIKGEPIEDLALRRKQKMAEEQAARKQAQKLVMQLKREKKQLQQKKRKQAQKAIIAFKLQQEQKKRQRQQSAKYAQQQKRRAIQQRISQQKRKKQQRLQFQKQSQRVLIQLKKQQSIMKLRQELPQQVAQMQQKTKIFEKKKEVNFRQIQQHQRKYMIMKEQERAMKKDRSQSITKPNIPKYQKNHWNQKIQEEQFKKKQQQKIKEMQKKINVQKRMKYGELVKNIFLPKKKEEIPKFQLEQQPQEQSKNVLPRIPESQKRTTQSKAMKKFTEANRPFATAHNYKKPPLAVKEDKTQQIQLDDNQAKAQKKIKELQMRKQTKERLAKLQNKSLQKLPQSKPKYQNYLGKVGIKKRDQSLMLKKIVQNDKLSKEDKYHQMLKRANQMEKRAKFKEQIRIDGDQTAVNLYINSIQAKLAILQKF